MADYDQNLKNFIAQTGKSKVAVIVPLYGYWDDIKDNPLGKETLKATLMGLQTSLHQMYVFFVAEGSRVSKPVQNLLVSYMQAGNGQGVDMPKDSSYTDYVRTGLQVAHDDTDAAYFVVLNPWVYMQSIGIDMIVDRLNRADMAKVVSGYDMRPATDPENFNPEEFEKYFMQTPKEERAIDVNFFGMTRFAYELYVPDPMIRTSFYFKWDIAQCMYGKGFEVIRSQRLPIFVFDADIQGIENQADVESDKAYYVKKWGFSPEA